MKTKSQLQDMEVTYVGSNLDYWFSRVRDVFAGIGITAVFVVITFWDKFT